MLKDERLPNDNDIETRRNNIEALKGNPCSTIIPLLLKAMEDPSWRVRKTATAILIEQCIPEEYVNGLLNLLYLEDNAGARNSAIEMLIQLGKRTIPFLMDAFDTPNSDVRKFIIDIIGSIKDKKALPLFLKALKDEDENIRASSVEYLGQLGEPTAVDALIGILESGDVWTAYPAADALGRIGDRRAIPSLLNALSVKALREPALKALGRFSAPETLEHIVPFLMNPSKSIQEETVKTIEEFYHHGVEADFICNSIQKVCGPDSTKRLISLAWSKKPEVRAAAIVILGLLRDEETFIPLLELSEDENFTDVVRRALIFVGKDKPDSIRKLFLTEDIRYKRFIVEVAVNVASPSYYDMFDSLLDDKDGHLRALAAAGLSNIGDPGAVGPLMKLLIDPYVDVQEAAVAALSRFKGSLDIKELVACLKHRNPVMRKNAALILGRIGREDTVSELGFALKDEDIYVRDAVVNALASIKTGESVKHLIVALTDEDRSIQVSAALSLGAIGDEEALEPLILLLSDHDDSVRVAAARALGMIGDARAISHLISALRDSNGFVVTTAIEALSRIGGDEAKEAVIAILGSDDIEIRRTAIRSLSVFGETEAVIMPFLKDPDWATRAAAIEVLAQSPTENIRTEIGKLMDTEDDPVVRKAIEEFLHVR